MNFIAAWCLLVMNEEDAFWMLSVIVEELCDGYYSTSMIGLRVISLSFIYCFKVDQKVLENILRDCSPKLLHHLESQNVNLAFLCTKWLLCLFVNNLPSFVSSVSLFHLTTKSAFQMWDRFLLKGSEFILKLAYVTLKTQEESLLNMHDTSTFTVLVTYS